MKKLYDVKFTLNPADCTEEVKRAALKGELLFYKSGLTGHTDETGMMDCTEKFTPSRYRDELDSIGGAYCEEMSKNSDGIFEVTLKLPGGAYPYAFVINPEFEVPKEREAWTNVTMPDGSIKSIRGLEEALRNGGEGKDCRIIPDPNNLPTATTVSGFQQNSIIYVGDGENDARFPIADRAKAGTLSYMSYTDIDGSPQSIALYLPANYSKEKTYPLILVSHGGGGNEADWPHQGSINNIMDNLIAEGRTKEAVLVCMNNSVYEWDYAKIADNCEKCIIPFVEKLVHISPDVHDRAFCGLSMGSMTTLYMYMHRSHVYDYYGAFSGGLAGGEHFTLEDAHLKDVTLMIGTAEEDIAYNQRDIGVPPTIEKLKEKGLPYIPYFTTASHDWFCWPQMFEYFAEAVLWK